MPRTDWTMQEVDIVRQMAAQNEYARAIAERIGRTRNQVIGYCRRHHIKLKQGSGPVKPGRPRKKRKPKMAVIEPEVKLTREQIKDLQEQAEPEPLHLRVEQLELRHCRWPYGDRYPFTFCGHNIMSIGQSYCPFHIARSVP